MTQYIGQITVIIDADNESIAETSIRDFAQRIEDESDAVVFADHNGGVENYEEIERNCKRSLESGPTPSLASVAPRLLAAPPMNTGATMPRARVQTIVVREYGTWRPAHAFVKRNEALAKERFPPGTLLLANQVDTGCIQVELVTTFSNDINISWMR
jgi:hypothetical protein